MSFADRFTGDDDDEDEQDGQEEIDHSLTNAGRDVVPDNRPELRANVIRDCFGDDYALIDNADSGQEWMTSYEFVNPEDWR